MIYFYTFTVIRIDVLYEMVLLVFCNDHCSTNLTVDLPKSGHVMPC